MCPEFVIRIAPDGTPYRYYPEFNLPDTFMDGKPELPDPEWVRAFWRALAALSKGIHPNQMALPGLDRAEGR